MACLAVIAVAVILAGAIYHTQTTSHPPTSHAQEER